MGGGGGTERARAWPSPAGCRVDGRGGRRCTGLTHAQRGPPASRPPGTDVRTTVCFLFIGHYLDTARPAS